MLTLFYQCLVLTWPDIYIQNWVPFLIYFVSFFPFRSLEMHKALTLADPSATPTSMTLTSNHPAPLAAIPLAQYLKPMPLMGTGMAGMAIFDNLATQKNFTSKMKGGLTLQAAAAAKSNGNKFAPYWYRTRRRSVLLLRARHRFRPQVLGILSLLTCDLLLFIYTHNIYVYMIVNNRRCWVFCSGLAKKDY